MIDFLTVLLWVLVGTIAFLVAVVGSVLGYLHLSAWIASTMRARLLDALELAEMESSQRAEALHIEVRRLNMRTTSTDFIKHRRHKIDSERYFRRRAELSRRLRMVALTTWGRKAYRRDRSADGELWTFNADTERTSARQSVLIVICPSKKTAHALFVPSHLRTARAARAWTFGLSEREFAPEQET